MRGQCDNIHPNYSKELKDLILSMLHLNPLKRPSINQILAKPLLLNTHIALCTDMGKIPCRSFKQQNHTRGALGQNNKTSRNAEGLNNKQPCLQSTVHYWGAGILLPVKLHLPSADTEVKQVSLGRTQKAAVTKNGKLLVWETSSVNEGSIPGSPEGSQVIHVPRFIEGQVTIQQVSCGDLFTACLTDRGILMTLGSGANGCLGHGNNQDVSQAKIVEKLLGYEVVQVSCGASHVLAVTNLHKVYSWGRGDNGRLGLGTQESHLVPCYIPMNKLDADEEIPDRPGVCKPCAVQCGTDCSMIITTAGKLMCTGNNRNNKLGLDSIEPIDEVSSFHEIQTAPLNTMKFSKVSMGTSHSATITENGECYTFGSNQFGQLGCHDIQATSRLPHKPDGLSSKKSTYISCGDTFTVVVTADNCVYSWGKSARGRLGRLEENCSVPQAVTFPPEFKGSVVTSLSGSHGATLIAAKVEGRGLINKFAT